MQIAQKKASTEVGSAAAGRKDKKVDKYSNLSDHYHFVPVGIETYGAYGPQGIKLSSQADWQNNSGHYVPEKNYLPFIYLIEPGLKSLSISYKIHQQLSKYLPGAFRNQI